MDWRPLLIVSGGVVVFALIVTAREQSIAKQFFFEALRAHTIITDVLVDGRTVSVRSGEVTYQGETVTGATRFAAMRLAYARTLAERSPLFALPGTSPSALTYAVHELQQTANQLANIKNDAASADLIRGSLYPLDFLGKASDAEAARIAFIHTSDTVHEEAYYEAVRKEFTSYILGIHNFRTSVAQVVPDTTPPYMAAGKLVSKEAILSGLQNMEMRAKKTKEVFDTRITCLRGHTSRCNQQDLSLPSLSVSEPGHIDAESLKRARAIQSFFASIAGNIQLRDAPLIVLSKSVCTAATPSPPIFVVIDSKVSPGVPMRVRPMFVGDIRFIKIGEYGNLPFYQDLRSQGIEFVLSPPLLHYECMDEGRDFAAILSTQTILQSSSSTVLYEADAIRAANARSASGDPDGIAQSLAIKYNSTQFDQSLRDITWAEQENLNLTKDGLRPDLDITNLFFSRSGFASLFAVDNPSFVGDIMLFPSAFIPPSQQPYLYDSQLPPGVQKSKLREDIRKYVILHLKGLIL